MANYQLPPDPSNAILKRIYPWEEYDITLVIQWLYAQAKKTGFSGSFEDFNQRYGAYVEAATPQDVYDLIDNYTGAYRITPLVGIEQKLKTKNKLLNQDIIIDPAPETIIGDYEFYNGRYSVTPLTQLDQILRTENKILERDIVVDKIPYTEVSNVAGGTTVIIG